MVGCFLDAPKPWELKDPRMFVPGVPSVTKVPPTCLLKTQPPCPSVYLVALKTLELGSKLLRCIFWVNFPFVKI